MTAPLISIIVPVYNREKLLSRCLDTLVYQTLQEIEIIIIDDFSEDCSLTIAQHYQKLFSNKVFVYSNDKKGVANAKNKGIAMSRGKYITFVDSDDYVEYWAYETLYNYAEAGEYSIVCAPYIQVTENGHTNVKGNLPNGSVSCSELFLTEAFSLCTKIIRRQLFEQYGPLPDLKIGEDVAFLYPLLSQIENIGCISTPYYYYQLSENSISLRTFDLDIIEDIIKGNQIILRNSNPIYHDLMDGVVIKRTLSLMGRFWSAQDLFIQYLKTSFKDLNKTELIQDNSWFLEMATNITNMPNSTIPEIIYINAILADNTADVNDIKKKVFRDSSASQVIIIDKEYCKNSDIESVREAYIAGEYVYAAELQALHSIYITGGIYLTSELIINCSLNFTKYNSCFFCRETFNSFSSKIYGCMPKQPIIKKLLDTYTNSHLYKQKYIGLNQRIKTILICEANCHLSILSQQYIKQLNMTIYPPTMFLYQFDNYANATIYKPYYTFNSSTEYCLWKDFIKFHTNNSVAKALAPKNRRIAYLTAWNNRRIKYIEQLEKERDDLKNQIYIIKHTKSWVITKPLRGLLKLLRKVSW